MLDRIKLTKNAQFYIIKPEKWRDDLIIELLDLASENKDPNPKSDFIENKIREETDFLDSPCKYSLRIFPALKDVYFIQDPEEKFFDRIYAYILIVEIGKYVAVIKKSCSNIKSFLDEHFDLINQENLTIAIDENNVEFQKLSARNMTVSDKAIRARSYEAANLNGLLSTHITGRSIPYFLKIKFQDTIKTFNISSGRVVESSPRLGIEHIIKWVDTQLSIIKSQTNSNEFLELFAIPVNLVDVLKDSNTNSILLETGALDEKLTANKIDIKYKTKSNKYCSLNKWIREKLISFLSQVFEVNKNLEICEFNSPKKLAKLRVNNKSLTFSSNKLSKYSIFENGKEYSLTNYLIKKNWYSICFDKPQYMYFGGACFKDKNMLVALKGALDIFIPLKELQSAQSEKGNGYSGQCTEFKEKCLFRLVEDKYHQVDYMFCDDLGDEWADHITLNDESTGPEIEFIHSKHGTVSNSASKFHDVVGQGIKNLGNMFFNKEQFLKKPMASQKNYYKPYGAPVTSISRFRKGNEANLDTYLDKIISDYSLRRKCVLVCSFISKRSISIEFNNLISGQQTKGNISQMVWILSSFIHSCKELNVTPKIYCQP